MAKNKDEKSNNSGAITLIICGILSLVLIVACVFFPDEVFGLFTK